MWSNICTAHWNSNVSYACIGFNTCAASSLTVKPIYRHEAEATWEKEGWRKIDGARKLESVSEWRRENEGESYYELQQWNTKKNEWEAARQRFTKVHACKPFFKQVVIFSSSKHTFTSVASSISKTILVALLLVQFSFQFIKFILNTSIKIFLLEPKRNIKSIFYIIIDRENAKKSNIISWPIRNCLSSQPIKKRFYFGWLIWTRQ